MSQENVELVKRAFDAWNRGDVEWLAANADPDVEIKALTTALSGEPYRGPDGVRRWLAESYEAFEVIELGLEELREAGSRVLGFGNLHWRGGDSGIDMNLAVTWVFTFRHGKVLRMEMFADRAEALQAAGLRE